MSAGSGPAGVGQTRLGGRAVRGLELNGRMHSDVQAVPAERSKDEQQVLRPVPSLRVSGRSSSRFVLVVAPQPRWL